jgi:hypothetical protein
VLVFALVRWDLSVTAPPRSAQTEVAQVREPASAVAPEVAAEAPAWAKKSEAPPPRRFEAPAAPAAKERALPAPPETPAVGDLAKVAPPPATAVPAGPPAERRITGGVAGGVIGGIVSVPRDHERKSAATRGAPAAVAVEAAAPPAPLGVQATGLLPRAPLLYRILRRTESGRYVEADPRRRFRKDDSLRLAVKVEQQMELRIATPLGVLWSGTAYPGQETFVFIPPDTARITVTGSGPPTVIHLNYE